MRILQLIDSLEVGGAERMAVNYANALSTRVAFSGIVSTRKEGALRSRIDKNVFFECLNKRFTFDLISIVKLSRICKSNKVDLIHAHGTSYFSAFLLKLILPKIKIVWHEHAGVRSEKNSIHNITLLIFSRFFSGIIVVNHNLENWCRNKLSFNQVIYLPNFTSFNSNETKNTILTGIEGKRIVCLANLKHPKNHHLLLEVAIKLKHSYPDWTFHFIGKDFQDDYSDQLKTSIKTNDLVKNVFIYDICEDIDNILQQASIGVLTSSFEGLPVALLEYGFHRKAVVVTNVGEIPQIVEDNVNGFVVPSNSVDLFYKKLEKLVSRPDLITIFGNGLHETIINNHKEEAVMTKYINWIRFELKC